MTTALSIVAQNTGASEEDIKDVIAGMIISTKKQHGATASNAELAIFIGVCAKYGLNPLVKECAAFISGGKLQVMVMIDGWYKMVNRKEDFDGVEFDDNLNDKGEIISITCRMYLKSRSRPACATEYMAECKDVTSSVWKRWPNRMLRHKAYIQAARIAFGISEVIDDDEASRIRGNTPAERDITPKPSVSLTGIETAMADCKTLESLQAASGKIREEMQTNGTWNSHKAEIIALNVKHKDRINSKKEEATFDEETGEVLTHEQAEPSKEEAIEGELLSSDDGATRGDGEDVGFGEDLTDEFGE